MPALMLRAHHEIIFAYSTNHTEVIVRVENEGKAYLWAEADIQVPESISLAPMTELRKGRVRIGIIGKNEFLEKATRIYAMPTTAPQVYRCGVVLYLYNKDGVIEKRMEKEIDIRCEFRKKETI